MSGRKGDYKIADSKRVPALLSSAAPIKREATMVLTTDVLLPSPLAGLVCDYISSEHNVSPDLIQPSTHSRTHSLACMRTGCDRWRIWPELPGQP